MKAVIMAGGKGTRIASVNASVPKPLIKICGKPVLQYTFESLKKQGIHEFIVVVGHLYKAIQDYFEDGTNYGIQITYIVEQEPLGTAGALYYLKESMKEDFLLINGDIVFDIDLSRLVSYHRSKNGLATIYTHPNNHPYDSALVVSDETGCVTEWIGSGQERTSWYDNNVNAGIHILSWKIFQTDYICFNQLEKKSLDEDVLRPLMLHKELFAYKASEYIRDMGTPDRLLQVTADIKSQIVQQKNLGYRQKAIFLDRDGTINRYVGFLTNIDQMELLPGIADAIKQINASGYLAIVITNQPVIARGEVTREQLQSIHNKMVSLLGEQGAYLDDIYFCPHHPDAGYEGEIRELKIDCNCRKPKPGLILQAAIDYNVDLSSSWMVGDSESDICAGKNAGCHTAIVGHKMEGIDDYSDLLSFCTTFFKEKR